MERENEARFCLDRRAPLAEAAPNQMIGTIGKKRLSAEVKEIEPNARKKKNPMRKRKKQS